MPNAAPEKEDELSHLDPDLRPDEQSYVSHYLNYADVLLNNSEDEGNAPDADSRPGKIIRLPTFQEPEPDESGGSGSGNAA